MAEHVEIGEDPQLVVSSRLDAVRFMQLLYRELLQREPDPGEVQSWVQGISSGLAPDEVLARFVASEEFRRVRSAGRPDARRFATLLYPALLEREGDAEEIAGWERGLQAGLAPEDMLEQFVASEEFRQRRAAGRLDARRFASLLYPALLNRQGDPEEIAGWERGLQAGLAPEDMLEQFVASEEFRRLRAQEGIRMRECLTEAYRSVAQCDPGPDEEAVWAGDLEQGAPFVQVLGRVMTEAQDQRRTAGPAVEDARRLVSSLYRVLLDRDGTADELAAWAAGIAGGQLPGEVLQRFLDSEEYKASREAKRSQAGRVVRQLFTLLLEREPTDAEAQGWADAIGAGMPLDEVLESFAGSQEFRDVRRVGAPLFVPPGHFYSPVVDPATVRDTFASIRANAPASLPGIAIDRESQLAAWRRLVPHLARIPFPAEKSEGFRYWFRNDAYGVGDASVYFGLLMDLRPRRIIEVGSGFSSACALDTIDRFFDHPVEIDFIEPYPALLQSLLGETPRSTIRIHATGVQDVDPALFEQLGEGDILFIDSTHVLKTGSDVHSELFDILPRLRKGVVIHIHDMFWPFEYPRSWVVDQNRSWNELYAVRAFLMYQDAFEILFFNDYALAAFPDEIKATYPAFLDNTGGALWLRKVR